MSLTVPSQSPSRALTTADLPLSFLADPAALAVRDAAKRAGLTLARTACACSPQREDCPTCLAGVLKGLVLV